MIEMNKKKNAMPDSIKCQKCGENIGGKAYYIIPLDCMYDGMELSQCKTIVLCSQCNNKLKVWLEL